MLYYQLTAICLFCQTFIDHADKPILKMRLKFFSKAVIFSDHDELFTYQNKLIYKL